MARAEALKQGRESIARHAWADAYAHLSAADREAPLDPNELERLAEAAYLLGLDDAGVEFLTRAHHGYLGRDEPEPAARCAFWLGFLLLSKGELARGGGWIGRARRLIDERGLESVVTGYLLLPDAIRGVEVQPAVSYETFCEAVGIARRFRDHDLEAMAGHGRGRALIRLGRIAEGVALLDEAMLAITADDASPLVVGTVYCSVIEACHEIFDLRRAREWTAALAAWCASQPDLVPYRGQCLVRRAEILQLRGSWNEAIEEVQRACERLSQPSVQRAIGAALYQRAELHRLRGEFRDAEDAYRESSRWGRTSQPGFSLLRLAQGQTAAAAAAIRTALDEARDPRTRSRLLAPFAEIMLAAGQTGDARAAADELSGIAATLDAPFLRALAPHVGGAVLLAEGEAREALVTLREAWTGWCEIEAPYEGARARVLLGQACRELADDEGAAIELEAARQTFLELGAAPDVARVDALLRHQRSARPGGLSTREIEVLRLVAAGKTNRAIAEALFISEKTVARHLSNIFNKLDLSSRAAATAYAYQHHLV